MSIKDEIRVIKNSERMKIKYRYSRVVATRCNCENKNIRDQQK